VLSKVTSVQKLQTEEYSPTKKGALIFILIKLKTGIKLARKKGLIAPANMGAMP
jgi:hypothetical protein